MSNDMPNDMPVDPRKFKVERGFSVPDLIQAVEGWRSYVVDVKLPRYGLPPKLRSVTATDYWAPRQTNVATCRYDCTDIPNEGCTCGFYSAKDLKHLLSMGYHVYDADEDEGTGHATFCVVAKVANWGKVIEGRRGWRAEKAYPVKLYVPYEANHLAKPLSETYGVPAKLGNFLKFRDDVVLD